MNSHALLLAMPRDETSCRREEFYAMIASTTVSAMYPRRPCCARRAAGLASIPAVPRRRHNGREYTPMTKPFSCWPIRGALDSKDAVFDAMRGLGVKHGFGGIAGVYCSLGYYVANSSSGQAFVLQ
jgi:hypothetical protein